MEVMKSLDVFKFDVAVHTLENLYEFSQIDLITAVVVYLGPQELKLFFFKAGPD